MKRFLLSLLLLPTCTAAGWAIGFHGTAFLLDWFDEGGVDSAIEIYTLPVIAGFAGGLLGCIACLYKLLPDSTGRRPGS